MFRQLFQVLKRILDALMLPLSLLDAWEVLWLKSFLFAFAFHFNGNEFIMRFEIFVDFIIEVTSFRTPLSMKNDKRNFSI